MVFNEAVSRLIARQLPKNVTNMRARLLKLFILIVLTEMVGMIDGEQSSIVTC